MEDGWRVDVQSLVIMKNVWMFNYSRISAEGCSLKRRCCGLKLSRVKKAFFFS